MDNQGDIEKYAKIADNSYGTATSKMEAYTDSVEASRQRMQNAIEKWSLQFEGQDVIKFFYDSIAYATENMHIFTATLMLLTAWLGKDTILSTLGNVFSKLGMKLTDFSLILDERLLNKKYAGSNATAIANVVFFNSLIVHNKLPVLFSGNIISMQKYKRFLMPFFITH